MLFVCNSRPRMSSSISNFKANTYLKTATVKDNICTTDEVTVNIVGSDGMCVDVPDGDYTDGTKLQLWPCGSQCNQQWTLMEDRTIRSKGKCIVSYRDESDSAVVIYDCSKIARERTLWSIWLNGTIVSANNDFVLTAEGSTPRSKLILATNLYAPLQGWKPDTNVEPLILSIVGYNDMCLQGSTQQMTNVWIESCSQDNANQKWAIYADGTMRKMNDPCICVTPDVSGDEYVIILRKCTGELVFQRWVFKADGVIMNPFTELVLEVKESDPCLRQIILAAPNMKPNQQWMQLF